MSEMVKFKSYIYEIERDIVWNIVNKKLKINHIISYPNNSTFLFTTYNNFINNYKKFNFEKFYKYNDLIFEYEHLSTKNVYKHNIYLTKSEFNLLISEDEFNKNLGIKIIAQALNKELKVPFKNLFETKFLLYERQ